MAIVIARSAMAENICFNWPEFGQQLNRVPTIDGEIDNDLGWSGVFSFRHQNGTVVDDGVLLVASDNNNLYFGWKVDNAPMIDARDAIILAFDDGNGNLRRFDIYPMCDSGVPKLCDAMGNPICNGPVSCPSNNRPRSIDYWTGMLQAGAVNWSFKGSPPLNVVNVAAKSASNGVSSYSWSVEMSIPRASTAAGYSFQQQNIKVYTDAFRINSPTPPTITQLVWPPNAGPISPDLTATPAVASWGIGSINGNCAALSITNIQSNGTITTMTGHQPAPNVINWDRTDMQLFAKLVNSTNNPISGLMTEFYTSNFGFSTDFTWLHVPAAGNPGGPWTAPATGSVPAQTNNWNVPADPNQSNYQAHPHQCIRVEVTSNTNLTIANQNVYANMDYGPASTFTSQAAEIRGDLRPVPPGRTKNQYDLLVNGSTSVDRQNVRLTLLVHGMQHTGKYLTLPDAQTRAQVCRSDENCPPGEKCLIPEQFTTVVTGRCVTPGAGTTKYEIVNSIGSFGYQISHAVSEQEISTYQKYSAEDLMKKWRFSLSSPEINLDHFGLRTIEIDPKAIVSVAPRIDFVSAENGGDKRQGCFACLQPKSTPAVIFITAGLMMVVGLFAYRRR
jgi:hypothetical protein